MFETNKHYIWFVLTILVGIFVANIFGLSIPVSMTTMSRSSELAVVGEGKIDVSPDTAILDAGIVVNNAKSVSEAQNKITTVNNAIIASMESLGIKKEDIKTSNFSLNPDYTYDGRQNTINGYSGGATISIKITDLSLVSQAIEKATAAGANQVQGARFTVDNPQKYREEVRNKAIANAREQAKKLAQTLGISLGKVTNIVESTPDTTIPYAYMEKATLQAGGAPNSPVIEPGTQTLSSIVTLYFEKK